MIADRKLCLELTQKDLNRLHNGAVCNAAL